MTETKTTVTYNIDSYRNWQSGTAVHLYLIPAAESSDGQVHVDAWASVGAGCPMPAWHNRWLPLGTLPQEIVPESLREQLQGQERELLEIAGHYQGSEWNGSNHVGLWSDGDLLGARVDALDLSCECYWTPADWYEPTTWPEILDGLREAGSVEDFARIEVANADGDATLDADDVARYVTDRIRTRIEELDGTEDDDDREELEFLRGLTN